MIRMVTGIVVATTAAVLLAGGCGDDSGNGSGSGAETTTAGPDATVAEGPLAGLDGDKLCGMVDLALLEEHFGEPFADALGGVNPPEQDGGVVCNYVSEAFMAPDSDLETALDVTTKVVVATGAATPQEALDAYMDGPVAYQPVDGLGAAAGFAGSDLDLRSGGSHLVVILEVGDALVEVLVQVDPTATVEQLRPIAEELFPKVESELR